VQIAVLLLTIGTILGAMWADVSWGRFWGWDPKEVWALITLLIYMVLLHGRHVGLSGNFSMALGAVFGFNAIVMAWFGVNFLLPGGKHSYGEGAGGQWYLLTVLLLDWLFVAAAVMRYLAENASTAERPAADGGDSS
jgi:cytochrome c biogenesis factor